MFVFKSLLTKLINTYPLSRLGYTDKIKITKHNYLKHALHIEALINISIIFNSLTFSVPKSLLFKSPFLPPIYSIFSIPYKISSPQAISHFTSNANCPWNRRHLINHYELFV